MKGWRCPRAALLDRPTGLLSGGEQQILALARVLAASLLSARRRVVAGLAPLILNRWLRAIRDPTSDQGLGVLLVEQQVRKALAVSDRAYIMRRGSHRARGHLAQPRETSPRSRRRICRASRACWMPPRTQRRHDPTAPWSVSPRSAQGGPTSWPDDALVAGHAFTSGESTRRYLHTRSEFEPTAPGAR